MEKQLIETDAAVIRFSGDSGDGMQLTGTLFADTAAFAGTGISTFPDFPAEIRAPQGTVAGVSGFQVHVGCGEIKTPGDFCDVLIAMNPAALKSNARWTKATTTIIVDADCFTTRDIEKAGLKSDDVFAELGLSDRHIVYAPISSLTRECLASFELDNKTKTRSKNMFALGICFYLYNLSTDYAEKYFEGRFKKKPQFIEPNRLVLKSGYNYAANIQAIPNTYRIKVSHPEKGKYRNITGNQAAAWGLIAASEKSGLSLFCGSYPITPATTILEELAARKDLGVTTLQVEDEIAGICTAIGASYAGNLAVTTTSGPGLSLKSEALGLAVMAELPLVIIDVQRGGPSTGLPTKPEQADLAQALWGRNGECPLIVMAALSPADCFEKAFTAAKLAVEHMTPVILLSDGFIANGSEPWKIPRMADFPQITPPIVPEGVEKYMPYERDTLRLARRWAIPGKKGLEHRIGGLEKDFIKGSPTIDPDNHQKMVSVRAEKIARAANYIPEQTIIGQASGELLVVGWGGTYGHLFTAVRQMQAEGKSLSLAQFAHINPMPKNTEQIFDGFRKIIVCELNSGQFANYLRMQFPNFKYLQYNKVQGLPFTVGELIERFNDELKITIFDF
ncbi:MAG: 2-oxoacid:acceptor oxidoreductase subunit alpha [Prevotellaceae bacterium]|jgi:2-oxoglutarate ferredoxin oxidoreductase subunit alpha|nr:2-oxoacid:acceptor oxidoreductase subunit alpha [Prevotellaceae bacterium]